YERRGRSSQGARRESSAPATDRRGLIVANWFWREFESWILVQRSQQKEKILGLDAEFFHFNFVGGVHAVARQKIANVRGRFLFHGEERIAELLLEVAMQVEIGAARVDHHLAGVVVEIERHVHALGRDLDPFL